VLGVEAVNAGKPRQPGLVVVHPQAGGEQRRTGASAGSSRVAARGLHCDRRWRRWREFQTAERLNSRRCDHVHGMRLVLLFR